MAVCKLVDQQLAELHINNDDLDKTIELEWTPHADLTEQASEKIQSHGYHNSGVTSIQNNRNSDYSQRKTCAVLNQLKKHRTEQDSIKPVHDSINDSCLASKDSHLTGLCPPILTSRLPPFSQRTKTAIINIKEDGSVLMEFISKKCSKEKITQVVHISSDGLQVSIVRISTIKLIMTEVCFK